MGRLAPCDIDFRGASDLTDDSRGNFDVRQYVARCSVPEADITENPRPSGQPVCATAASAMNEWWLVSAASKQASERRSPKEDDPLRQAAMPSDPFANALRV